MVLSPPMLARQSLTLMTILSLLIPKTLQQRKPVLHFHLIRKCHTLLLPLRHQSLPQSRASHLKARNQSSGFDACSVNLVMTGSVALVGYTVGKYTAKAFPNDVSLSLNLLWVAVLAAGDDAWAGIFCYFSSNPPSPSRLPCFHFFDDPPFLMLEDMAWFSFGIQLLTLIHLQLWLQ